MKNLKQHHRIHATGNRHENLLPASKKPARPNRLVNFFRQIAHAGMLGVSRKPGKVIAARGTPIFNRLSGDTKHKPPSTYTNGSG
jgi:hypothetical protein